MGGWTNGGKKIEMCGQRNEKSDFGVVGEMEVLFCHLFSPIL